MCEKITYVAAATDTKTDVVIGKAKAFFQNNKTPILIVAAVVVIYFMMKKNIIPKLPI